MKEVFPVVVVLFVLLIVTAAVTGGVLLLMPKQAVRVRLVYQIDSQSVGDPALVDMEAVVDAVRRRVNPGFASNARIEQLEGRRIKVGVFGDNPDEAERIERLLKIVGKLQFCLLPNETEHAEIRKKSKEQPDLDELRTAGNVVARWVEVHPDQESAFLSVKGILVREKTRGDREVFEALVVEGGFDDVNDYLQRVAAKDEGRDRHFVEIRLNAAGAKRYAELIGESAFGPAFFGQDEVRRLGVVLDGYLYAAVEIESLNFSRVEITGPFTRQDVEVLAAVLNAGVLPAALELVE